MCARPVLYKVKAFIFKIFYLFCRECSSGTVTALERILEIWKERDVYDQIFLDRLRKGMSKYSSAISVYICTVIRNISSLTCMKKISQKIFQQNAMVMLEL